MTDLATDPPPLTTRLVEQTLNYPKDFEPIDAFVNHACSLISLPKKAGQVVSLTLESMGVVERAMWKLIEPALGTDSGDIRSLATAALFLARPAAEGALVTLLIMHDPPKYLRLREIDDWKSVIIANSISEKIAHRVSRKHSWTPDNDAVVDEYTRSLGFTQIHREITLKHFCGGKPALDPHEQQTGTAI